MKLAETKKQVSDQVTVIIPVYNAETYLYKAVVSAVHFPEVREVILVEDGSPDNALDVCQKLVNEFDKVLLYRHPCGQNLGAGASRNLGIEKASSKYISFLDADDVYLPNRFEAEQNYWHRHEEFDGMYGALGVYYHSDELKEKFDQSFFSSLTVLRGVQGQAETFEALIGLHGKKLGHIHLNTLTIKRSCLSKMGNCFNSSLRLHQDTEFIVRLAFNCHLIPGIIDRPIALRGVHQNNRITGNGFRSKKYYRNQIALWQSLKDYFSKIQVKESYSTHLQRKIYFFELAETKPLNAWAKFLVLLVKDKNIVKGYRIFLPNMLWRNGG